MAKTGRKDKPSRDDGPALLQRGNMTLRRKILYLQRMKRVRSAKMLGNNEKVWGRLARCRTAGMLRQRSKGG